MSRVDQDPRIASSTPAGCRWPDGQLVGGLVRTAEPPSRTRSSSRGRPRRRASNRVAPAAEKPAIDRGRHLSQARGKNETLRPAVDSNRHPRRASERPPRPEACSRGTSPRPHPAKGDSLPAHRRAGRSADVTPQTPGTFMPSRRIPRRGCLLRVGRGQFPVRSRRARRRRPRSRVVSTSSAALPTTRLARARVPAGGGRARCGPAPAGRARRGRERRPTDRVRGR